jgi:hypothetical protein
LPYDFLSSARKNIFSLESLSSRKIPAILIEAGGRVSIEDRTLHGFRPKRVLFRPGGVNLRACLCGVPLPAKAGKRNDRIMYASAQASDFLARTKNTSLLGQKIRIENCMCLIRCFRMDISLINSKKVIVFRGPDKQRTLQGRHFSLACPEDLLQKIP